jgi:hypothetical protein
VSYPTRVQFAPLVNPTLTSLAKTYTFSQACTAGNLIVVCYAGDKNTGTLTMSDDVGGANPWAVETAIPGASVSLYIAHKVAVGGETVVTATVQTAPPVGSTGYAEELADDGAGAWTVVAKATPTYSDTSRNTAASGTTDTADYDGRAVAVGVIDSMSSLGTEPSRTLPTFSAPFTKIYDPAWPSGSGGGSAGCYIGTADLASGATTSTTFATNGGSDQLTCAIAAFGRVESSSTTGTLDGSAPMPVSALAGSVSAAAPGAVFDLDNWKATLPVEDPNDPGDALEVKQPELDTYSSGYFYLDAQSRLVCYAPAVGETTSGSSGTRSELREMEGPAEAGWNLATTGVRRLTVTGAFDPTSITGGTQPRKEMIVGQIHGPSGTPPLYLTVEHTSGTAGTPVTPRLRVYKDGPGLANILSPLTATTQITYRIEVGNGRCKLWAAIGDVTALPATPQYDWAAADFTEDTSVCYFKAGSYNKTTVASDSSGGATATITHLELVQPGAPPAVAGALAASLPVPAMAGTGAVWSAGALAASLPLPTTSSTGTVRGTGALAAALSLPTAALAATVTNPRLVATLPLPTAALAGVLLDPGTLIRHPRLGVDRIALRLSGGAGPVRIDFSLASNLSSPISSVEVTPTVLGDAHVPIPAGLAAGTTYYFRPYRGGAYIGTVRSFATLPGVAQTSFAFTFGSCRDTGADTPVLGQAIDRGADLFLHLGDANYEDTNSTNASLYRANDDEQYTHTALTRALCEIPNAYTWSDHDFCGDSSTAASTGKATVRQVYRERVPSPTLPSATGGIYHTFRTWGGRVRFIVLDTRSYRDSIGTNADGTMLGAEQLSWLQDLLAAADSALTFMVSAEGWHSSGDDDDWGFYQNERSTIAGWITTADTEVVMLCGDMHALTYATPANGTPGGVHVWHAAGIKPPFANGTKGGPYAVTPHYHGDGAAGLVELVDSGTQITATFRGLRANTTDWSGTDSVTVATAAVGSLAGSLPRPTSAVAGGVRATSAAAAALPMPSAALAGAVRSTGALAATLPAALGAVVADGHATGTLGGTVSTPSASLAAAVRDNGALAAALALPVAVLVGALDDDEARLQGRLPVPLVVFAAALRATAELAAALPVPTAALRVNQQLDAGPFLVAGQPVREVVLRAGEPVRTSAL